MDRDDLKGVLAFFGIVLVCFELGVGITDYCITKYDYNKLKREAIYNNFAEMAVEKDRLIFKWKNQDLCEKGQSLNGEAKPETAFTESLLLHSRSCPQCWNRIFKGNVKDYEHCMKLSEESETSDE